MKGVIFETGSSKYLTIKDKEVKFVSSLEDATAFDSSYWLDTYFKKNLTENNKLKHCADTLVFVPTSPDEKNPNWLRADFNNLIK